MKNFKNNITTRFPIFFLIWFLIAPVDYLSQTADLIPTANDTLKNNIISIEEIPIQSGETSIKINRLETGLIGEEEIKSEKAINDSLLFQIDSMIITERPAEFNEFSNRFIRNRINVWNGYAAILDKRVDQLTDLLKTLGEQKKFIGGESERWNNTKSYLYKIKADSTTFALVDDIIDLAGKTDRSISNKTLELLPLLNFAARQKIEIEGIIEKLESVIKNRQDQLFIKSHKSLFEFDYTNSENWKFANYWNLFYKTEIQILISYYKNHKDVFLIYLIFNILMIFLFISLKSRTDKLFNENSTYYQKLFSKILYRPISVALILGLFASVVFFSNQPPILLDMFILVMVVPLLDIVFKITSAKFHKYFIVFSFMVVIRLINIVFPIETISHRILLLVQSSVEVFFLYLLFRDLKKDQSNISKTLSRIIQVIIMLHLSAAAFGFLSNISGHLLFAKITIDLIITNTLVGLLLFILAITLIGLMQLAVESKYFSRLKFIRSRNTYLKNLIVRVIILLTSLIWFDAIVRILGLNNNFYDYMDNLLNGEFSIGFASFTIGRIFLFFFVIWLSIIAARIIKIILEDDILDKVSLKKGIPRIISVMAYFSLVAVGVFLAVSIVGMPLDQLTIIFSAFSVGIGFGLQNIVNNFVSGIILLFERPIQIGDTVEIGNLIGNVKSMGIRSSNVRTFDGAEVIVPNGHLISNEVVNWTLSDKRRRIEIISGVAYGSDVHKVQKILLEVLNDHPDIIKDPQPMVLFNDLGESSLDFRLLFWTDNFDEWIRIRSEVVFMIHDTLYAEGITIPFPQRDLHIKSLNGLQIFDETANRPKIGKDNKSDPSGKKENEK